MATTAQLNININAKSANKSVDDLNKSLKTAGGSSNNLRLELKEITKELQGLEPGTARFQELSNRAGQLRDTIQDTNSVINATAGNVTERFGKALTSTLSIGVAGFQGLTAVQSLFGAENEDLNKSIQQFTALLNFSQAIETFGGLGDKITEIRAGFGGLTTATNTQTIAQEGENIATTQGTVATTALGVAMKALPIIAIVAGLATLTYGIYQYATANDDAAEQEKKRLALLKAQKEAQNELAESVAEESTEFVMLISKLKETNKNSTERKKLIKEINDTYGTTLKNLSDENEFQTQLNTSVKEYITVKENEYRLSLVEDKFKKVLIEKIKLQGELNKFQKDNNDLLKGTKIRTTEEFEAFVKTEKIRKLYETSSDRSFAITLGVFRAKIEAYEREDKKLQELTKRQGYLEESNDRLTKGGKVYVEQLDDQTKSIKDATDATDKYDDILKQIIQTQEDNKKQEDELLIKRLEVFDKTKDTIEVQRKLREEAALKEFEAVRISIEKEITEEKKKTELLKLNEDNLTKYLSIEQEKRRIQIQETNLQIIDDAKKRYDYLILEEQALQNEIRFGDGNTSDTKLSLQKRELDSFKSRIDETLNFSKYQNKIELEDYLELLNKRRETYLKAAEIDKQDKINIANADAARQIELEQARIESYGVFTIKTIDLGMGKSKRLLEIKDKEVAEIAKMDKSIIDDKILQYEIEIDGLQKVADLAEDKDKGKALQAVNAKRTEQELYEQKVLLATKANQEITLQEKNLNQAVLNIDEELIVRRKEAVREYSNEVVSIIKKSEEDILDERIKRFDDYLTYISNGISQASNLISQFARQQTEISTQQLNNQIATDRERIESQYAEALISREQYDNEIRLMEQEQEEQQKAIDLKNFKTEKALSIAGATIDGARAVLGAFAGTQGGIVVRSLAATLAGVFAATQIGLIARQEFTAATGGIVPGAGSGTIDSVPSRLAPGEAVINSKSTQAFLPLLSAINEVGGGKSFVPDLPGLTETKKPSSVFGDDKVNQPIRAYVVESEISSSQKRIDRIKRSAEF